MAKKAKKKGTAKAAAKGATKTHADQVPIILDEIVKYIRFGLQEKQLSAAGEKAIRDDLGKRVAARLEDGGDWPKEKARPLLAATHVGEISHVLSSGDVVSESVALKAYMLVKSSDESCKKMGRDGGSGGGDWCS